MMRDIMRCKDKKKGMLIQDYCLGLLSEEKEVIFENHLYECTYCFRKTMSSLKSNHILKNRREIFYLQKNVKSPSDSSCLKRLYIWNKKEFIAAVISVVFLVPAFFLIYLSQNIPLQYRLDIPSIERMKRVCNVDARYQNAIMAFQGRSYESSLEHFEKYLKSNPDNFDSLFYAGLCLLKISKKEFLGIPFKVDKVKAEKGIKYLEKSLKIGKNIKKETGNIRYLADAMFYLGKAKLLVGEKKEAREYFKKYLKLDDPLLPYRRQAKILLSSIP